MAFLGMFISGKQRRIERAGFELYAATVAAARTPYYFTDLAVPDTLDGRFDLVGLFAAVLIRRLRGDVAPGGALAQAVFDAMFSDMDVNLREMGVGDMSVGKRVRAMWEGFHGRALAYEAPLAAGDVAGLSEALARNVWRGANEGGALQLARQILKEQAHLAAIPLERLVRGEVEFLGP